MYNTLKHINEPKLKKDTRLTKAWGSWLKTSANNGGVTCFVRSKPSPISLANVE